MKFKTETTLSVLGIEKALGIPDIDMDTYGNKLTVNWSVDIDAREWGIKSISTAVDSVTGQIRWEVSTEYLTENERHRLIGLGGKEYKSSETIDGEIEIDSSKEWQGKKWTLTSDLDINMGCPNDVEIDFIKMIIHIS